VVQVHNRRQHRLLTRVCWCVPPNLDIHTSNKTILVAPCFKNLLRLEAGYPALRCHNLKQSTGHTHTTHTTKTKTTQNSKTAKHSHTHKTHSRSRNDERQRLSSCCQSQSRRRRPQDCRRWFDARRAAEGGDVVGLTVRSMVTVAKRRPRRLLEEEPHTPQRLEIIPPGFGLFGIIIRDQNNFSARDKRPATSKQQSGVRSRRTSCPRSSSSRVSGTRRGAGSATCSR